MELESRVALVTGASGRGMGRSIALTLAREGADIVVNFRERRKRAEELAGVLESMGRRALVHQADVSNADAVAAMFEAAEARFGRVDIVVASAGSSWEPRDITDIEPAQWREVMAEEIDAAYALLRAALPGMRERGWGRIVLIGGRLADAWRFGPPDAPLDYPLGKAARHWLARTLGPLAYISLDEARRRAQGGPAEGGEPSQQDVAEAVAFLCSERARFVTGAVIPVLGQREV